MDIAKNSEILIALDIAPHFVENTHGKQNWEASSESEQEFFPLAEKPSSQKFFPSREKPSGSTSTQKRYKEETDQTTDKEETGQKTWSSFT